jgi:hypothetical protein
MPFNLANEWKPTKKQAAFLSVPFSIREALYGGGAGSAKTEVILMFPVVHGFHENSRYKQLIMRGTTKQIKKEILPRSYEIYPKFGAIFNESDMLWTFPRLDQFGSGAKPTGARVYLGHCENEQDVHIYDGMEINVYSPDEITSLTYSKYSYIGFTRVRSSDPLLPAVIRAGGMPGDVGHSWVKKRFVDPYPTGGKRIIGKGGNSRIYIHATQADNPHIDPNYRAGLELLPEAEKQAKLYGNWEAYLGQVFEEFRDVHYVDEPANALHVVKPFLIPNWWPRICAIDWGYSAMCSIGWGAISPNKKLYVYRHQHFTGRKIEEWAPSVRMFIDKEQPSDIVICHSANQHRGDPHTILEQVSEALGVGIRLGEKNRLAGKMLLHEYLRWQQKPQLTAEQSGEFDNEIAQWLLRNRSRKEYEQYLAVYNKINEIEDIPRVQFFDSPDVKLVCDAIKACVYENEGSDGKKKEDVKEFNGDDPYDMVRMLLHSADQFFGVASDKAKQLEATNDVITRLNETGDVTQFYRNMRKLESEEIQQPISRYHRGSSRSYHA